MSHDKLKMMWIIDTIDTYNKFHNKFSFSQILIINFTINFIIVKIINCDINTYIISQREILTSAVQY